MTKKNFFFLKNIIANWCWASLNMLSNCVGKYCFLIDAMDMHEDANTFVVIALVWKNKNHLPGIHVCLKINLNQINHLFGLWPVPNRFFFSVHSIIFDTCVELCMNGMERR